MGDLIVVLSVYEQFLPYLREMGFIRDGAEVITIDNMDGWFCGYDKRDELEEALRGNAVLFANERVPMKWAAKFRRISVFDTFVPNGEQHWKWDARTFANNTALFGVFSVTEGT
tara:strand:+ start:817 stop:1158 length:342 start_codon:yes stop_codon:yes gene_type:complete